MDSHGCDFARIVMRIDSRIHIEILPLKTPNSCNSNSSSLIFNQTIVLTNFEYVLTL